ncbi:MAG: DNA-binding protein [Segetibacter sp.]|nr:DNA-binding protein [Segetibacter sp.]
MTSKEDFFKSPSAQEFLKEFRYELQKAQRPADQIILDESDFCTYLKISKRHAANLRTTGAVTYSKAGGKLYYRLSDVLGFIARNEIKSVEKNVRLFKSNQ